MEDARDWRRSRVVAAGAVRTRTTARARVGRYSGDEKEEEDEESGERERVVPESLKRHLTGERQRH